MERPFSIVRPDGANLFGLRYGTAEDGRYTVFLGHSHVVHCGMLRSLAHGFEAAHCQVLSGDIRGHGKSVGRAHPPMHLDGADGWRNAVDDFIALTDHAFKDTAFEERIVVVPNIMALAALDALKSRPDLAAQIVLIAPPPNQPLLARLGAAFAGARAHFRNRHAPDEQMLHHIYTYLGSQLPERDHLLDVVSPDPTVIRAILDDPLSWIVPTTAYWQAIFHGMQAAWSWPSGQRINRRTRFLILYGEADPMTRDGAFCGPMIDHLLHRGAEEVTAMGVAGARTGIFMEEDRLGISRRILSWADKMEAREEDRLRPQSSMAENFVREYFQKTPAGNHQLTAEDFVSLAYSAVQDETRWIEIMMRMLLTLAEGANADIEQFMIDMMPHWDRAYGLRQSLLTNVALGDVWSDVLDRLGIACALVDGNGRILHANDRYGDALTSLLAAPPRLPRTRIDDLTRALLSESATHGGPLSAAGSILKWEDQPVGVFFRPPSLNQNARQLGTPAGLVVLRDQEASSDQCQLIELAFGLTHQEAKVALGLMNGESPTEIAASLKLSINTVRTHLAHLYAKTGTSGQPELIVLLLKSPLGWAGSLLPPATATTSRDCIGSL